MSHHIEKNKCYTSRISKIKIASVHTVTKLQTIKERELRKESKEKLSRRNDNWSAAYMLPTRDAKQWRTSPNYGGNI